MSRARPGGRLTTAVAGAVASRLIWRRLTARPPGGDARWTRTNHRGEPLTLLEGPTLALASAAAITAAPGVPARLKAAGVIATLGAAGFGLVDDLGERGNSKGLRGHLAALRRAELTTGGLKIIGIGVTGLLAGRLAAGQRTDRRRAEGGGARLFDVVTDAALIAGTANLFNLLDLRPGRSLKVALVAAPAVLVAHPAGGLVAAAAGPALAMLPEDLAERAMLGDCGANALGALLGTALVSGAPRSVRASALAGVVVLTLASEKVSFTSVIESTPVLRELDALGRRPR